MTSMPSHASIHLENVWHGLNGVTRTCHGINHNCGLDISLTKGNVLVPCYVFCSCSWQKGLNVPLGSKGSYLVLYYCLFMNEHEVFHTYLQHLFITSQHFILLYIFRGLHYTNFRQFTVNPCLFEVVHNFKLLYQLRTGHVSIRCWVVGFDDQFGT